MIIYSNGYFAWSQSNYLLAISNRAQRNVKTNNGGSSFPHNFSRNKVFFACKYNPRDNNRPIESEQKHLKRLLRHLFFCVNKCLPGPLVGAEFEVDSLQSRQVILGLKFLHKLVNWPINVIYLLGNLGFYVPSLNQPDQNFSFAQSWFLKPHQLSHAMAAESTKHFSFPWPDTHCLSL